GDAPGGHSPAPSEPHHAASYVTSELPAQARLVGGLEGNDAVGSVEGQTDRTGRGRCPPSRLWRMRVVPEDELSRGRCGNDLLDGEWVVVAARVLLPIAAESWHGGGRRIVQPDRFPQNLPRDVTREPGPPRRRV